MENMRNTFEEAILSFQEVAQSLSGVQVAVEDSNKQQKRTPSSRKPKKKDVEINAYEKMVNNKVKNQKMLKRLDIITDKLLDNFEAVPDDVPKSVDLLGVCSLCKLVILDIAVVTGDQSFHQECFACDVCGDLLDVKMFYQLEDKFFCEKDKEACLDKCSNCGEFIIEGSVNAEGTFFHQSCFKCSKCQHVLVGDFYVGPKGEYLCPHDYQMIRGKCSHCEQILDGKTITALGKSFHLQCFKCSLCNSVLSTGQFISWQGAVNCRDCFKRFKADICARCKDGIVADKKDTRMVSCNGLSFHEKCYKCKECLKSLVAENAFEKKGELVCKSCNNKVDH